MVLLNDDVVSGLVAAAVAAALDLGESSALWSRTKAPPSGPVHLQGVSLVLCSDPALECYTAPLLSF